MIRRLIILFKIGRKLAQSEVLNILSKFHQVFSHRNGDTFFSKFHQKNSELKNENVAKFFHFQQL